MKARLFPVFLGAAVLAATSGCVAENATRAIDPQQAALVKAACVDIMRTGGSAVDRAACMSSLADSLADKMQGAVAWKSDRDCAAQGLTRGSADFSMCVLDRERGYSAVAAQGDLATASPPRLAYNAQAEGSEGYYDASFDTQRRREEDSCAQLGLDPNANAFGNCVAGLDAALFNADHPNP